MSAPKTPDSKDINPEITPADMSQQSTSPNNRQSDSSPTKVSTSVFPELETRKRSDSHSETAKEKGGELIRIETKSRNKTQEQAITQQWKAKTTAILVGAAVMVPILAVGTVTYYFGSQAINKQAIFARRHENRDLAEAELAREQKLLAALLIGTGTTALLVGVMAAWGTKRLIKYTSKKSTEEPISKDEPEAEVATQISREFSQNLNQSVPQKDLLQAIVEEARNYLHCDRVVVYSLNQDQYGVIVAESVALGYTSALGKIIKDPCFESRYLDQYRDGRVRAIDNIYEAEMTPCHLDQLEQLEVKANLVTPIINEGQLFGLLVAHQCAASRHWQQAEIEFLHQLAKKVGLALDNAKLLHNMSSLQSLAATERKWTNYLTDAIQHIRQSIKQDDVLDVSVKEVRRVLECDRVVVYSLNQDNYGVVVAESVAPGYPRALHKTIKDPCFEARYLDKYRDGRVRALNNIYEAGMTDCYLEQLERLEVKANLVTPILNEGKLFGLLVAHQCSQPRDWQDYEIRWMTQIATQVGFALDNAQILSKLENKDVSTELLNSFTLGIRDRLNQSELLKTVVEQARKGMGLDRALIYQFDADWNGTIVAESVVLGYPRTLHSQIKDPCFAREYAEKYRQGRIQAIANIAQANLTHCYLEQLESFAVKASLVAPILQDGQLFGLFIGHQCSQPRPWEQSAIDLFAQLALQLGLALERVKLREELDQANNISGNEPHQKQLEQDRTEPLPENPVAPQNLKAEISDQSQNINGLIEQAKKMIERAEANATDNSKPQEQLSDGETIEQSNNTQLKKDVTQEQEVIQRDLGQGFQASEVDSGDSPLGLPSEPLEQEAIVEAREKVEILNQSHQDLSQMVSLINEMKEKMKRSESRNIKPAQLPMDETPAEANEVNLNSINKLDSEVNQATEPND